MSIGLVQHPCQELLYGGLLSLLPGAYDSHCMAWGVLELLGQSQGALSPLCTLLLCFFSLSENKWAIHPRGGHVGPPTNPASAGVTVSHQPASPGGEGTVMAPWASSPLTASCSLGRPLGCQEH